MHTNIPIYSGLIEYYVLLKLHRSKNMNGIRLNVAVKYRSIPSHPLFRYLCGGAEPIITDGNCFTMFFELSKWRVRLKQQTRTGCTSVHVYHWCCLILGRNPPLKNRGKSDIVGPHNFGYIHTQT